MGVHQNESYYEFLKIGRVILDGIPLLKETHLIPFKIKAWLDLCERKARGESVDSKHIRKHKNDVFRLAQIITPNTRVEVQNEIKMCHHLYGMVYTVDMNKTNYYREDKKMALIDKNRLSKIVDKTKEASEKLKDNAVAFIDQNNDGELTSEDFERVKIRAKELAQDGKDIFDAAMIEREKKKYNPISNEDLTNIEFKFPRMIRLMDENPYLDKETCKDAVGFYSTIAKNNVLELIKGKFDDSIVEFYPNTTGLVYLKNPYKENMYISINEYFTYFKKARVTELVDIANKLGAKYVKITYKEEEKSFVSLQMGESEEIKGVKGIGFKEKNSAKASSKALRETAVATEEILPGHNNPVRPELLYFKGDSEIEQFIERKLGENAPLKKTFTIKYSNSRDINIELATGVDAVLNKLKFAGSASVKSEVEKEKRTYLAYEIEF